MSLATVYTRASNGILAPLITVEVHLSQGLPGLSIVGLPETAVKESKHRVRSAILNSHFIFPLRRITVNLAPADLPKEGSRFDLAIALGILAASKQIPDNTLLEYEFAGELALSGLLRPIRGALPFAMATAKSNRKLIIAAENKEAALNTLPQPIFSAVNLTAVCSHLKGLTSLPSFVRTTQEKETATDNRDLSEVEGQSSAKRALEVAACGQHSLLLAGPPGCGKTMLAERFPTLLPQLSLQEALEVGAIYSLTRQGLRLEHWRKRPFRAPHHSLSTAAMVGGKTPPYPGEVSLAHFGILFLDELPEFKRDVLESLREPLESGYITISRASYQIVFPAKFQLIAAMNPCACGYWSHPTVQCQCSRYDIKHYLNKISGPLLDRIDMYFSLTPEKSTNLITRNNESSATIKERVLNAQLLQMKRQSHLNNSLTATEVKETCQLLLNEAAFLEKAVMKFNLSIRGCHRVLKVARTIADLAASPRIEYPHLTEALNYRVNFHYPT